MIVRSEYSAATAPISANVFPRHTESIFLNNVHRSEAGNSRSARASRCRATVSRTSRLSVLRATISASERDTEEASCTSTRNPRAAKGAAESQAPVRSSATMKTLELEPSGAAPKVIDLCFGAMREPGFLPCGRQIHGRSPLIELYVHETEFEGGRVVE